MQGKKGYKMQMRIGTANIYVLIIKKDVSKDLRTKEEQRKV